MNKKVIDNIVWWIPIKRLRNYIRKKFKQFEQNADKYSPFLNRLNDIFNLCKNYNLNIENYNDANMNPFFDNNIFKNTNFNDLTVNNLINEIKNSFDMEKLEKSYYLLEDEYSKNMFISSIIARTCKYNGLQLILYYANSWKYYYDLDLVRSEEFVEINNAKLYLYDLSKLPFSKDIKLYYTQRQLFETYFLEQYRYKNKVTVEEGDYIIDGGVLRRHRSFIFFSCRKKRKSVFV